MTQAGVKKTFRDTLLDDYLHRRVEAGAAWGQFSREPMLKAVGSFRFTDTLALEGSLGQVQGLYSGSDFWHANLLVEPWSDRACRRMRAWASANSATSPTTALSARRPRTPS